MYSGPPAFVLLYPVQTATTLEQIKVPKCCCEIWAVTMFFKDHSFHSCVVGEMLQEPGEIHTDPFAVI